MGPNPPFAIQRPYFPSDFEKRLQKPVWMERFLWWEKELQGLDDEAWSALKSNSSQYLATKSKTGRGWQQLFDSLGEALAYNYLRGIGCQNVGFILRSRKRGVETPDLEATHKSGKVLCEVKTINVSDSEVSERHTSIVRDVKMVLEDGFFGKLGSDLSKADKQLRAYDPKGEAWHCIYINVCFDNRGYYADEQLLQVDRWLSDNSIPSADVIVRAGNRVLVKTSNRVNVC